MEDFLLKTFGPWLLEKSIEYGFNIFKSLKSTPEEITKRFDNAVKTTSREMNTEFKDVLGSDAEYFFTQRKVYDELIKVLFIDQEINTDKVYEIVHKDTLPKDYLDSFMTKLKVNINKDELLNQIFSNKKIQESLISIDYGVQKLNDSIEEISRMLKENFDNTFDYENFFLKYKEVAIRFNKTVDFLGLKIKANITRNTKQVDEIYVKPTFSKEDAPISAKRIKEHYNGDFDSIVGIDDELEISYSEILKRSEKLVVLGKPGSGKSLMTKSFVCDLLEKTQTFKDSGLKHFLPFRIEMRKYHSFKKENGGNILKYLNYILETEYGLTNINISVLQYIFQNVKCIVFFDGLDEIFNVSDKISVKRDIENFHTNFPNIRSVTTSRLNGYEEAKLDNTFSVLSINDFNQDQIQSYVLKWYKIEEPDVHIRNEQIQGFFEEKDSIDEELIKNPLLLSLIIILYRNTSNIPKSKLAIYEGCAQTLVDEWESIKTLDLDLDEEILELKEKILSDLAFWQYQELAVNEPNITFEKATLAVRDSIIKKLSLNDRMKAYKMAESFMVYAQKRSIYFDNNFTHKTFLEYYTAYWIYSNFEAKHKIEKRNEIITKYIDNPFWYIVLELLINFIDKHQADSDIIDEIIYSQLKLKKSIPFIFYVIPSIKNISQQAIDHIFNVAFAYMVKRGLTKLDKEEWNMTNIDRKYLKSLVH